MRRFDKLLNIERANLLAESLYLDAKDSLNELSPELKQKAYDKASYQASVHSNGNDLDNYNPLKADRRHQQAHTIGNTVSNKYIATVENLATYLGLKGEIKKYSDINGDKIVMRFNSERGEGSVYDKILQYNITKNSYDPYVKNVQLPDNFARRIERLIISLQRDELAGNDPRETDREGQRR
jgi:hypothetical protein